MSGEALASAASDETIDAATVERMAREMGRAMDGGDLELAVVVGGGNIWRGTTGESGGMDRATSDTMGMLGTVINALALQDALEQQGQPTRVLSALSMAEVAEPYIRRRAIRHLEKGRIVIFAAGMGNPFFTTDTPAALRAAEIGAELLCKGTHSGVDGVYSADPKLDPDATRYDVLDFIHRTWDVRVSTVALHHFCKKYGLDRAARAAAQPAPTAAQATAGRLPAVPHAFATIPPGQPVPLPPPPFSRRGPNTRARSS